MKRSFSRGISRLVAVAVFGVSFANANGVIDWYTNIMTAGQPPATSTPPGSPSTLYTPLWLANVFIPAFDTAGGFWRLDSVTIDLSWQSSGTVNVSNFDLSENHNFSNVYMSSPFTVTGPDGTPVIASASNTPIGGTTTAFGGGNTAFSVSGSGGPVSVTIFNNLLLQSYKGGPGDTLSFDTVVGELANPITGTDDGRVSNGSQKGKLLFTGEQDVSGMLHVQYTFSQVPEPGTVILVGTSALLGIIGAYRRRRKISSE